MVFIKGAMEDYCTCTTPTVSILYKKKISFVDYLGILLCYVALARASFELYFFAQRLEAREILLHFPALGQMACGGPASI